MDASTLHPECTLGRQTPVCRQLGHEAAFRADQGLRTRHGHRRLGNVVLSASLSGGRQWPTTVCCGHLSQMDTPPGAKVYLTDLASKNFTFLNGKRIEPEGRFEFDAADTIEIGPFEIRCKWGIHLTQVAPRRCGLVDPWTPAHCTQNAPWGARRRSAGNWATRLRFGPIKDYARAMAIAGLETWCYRQAFPGAANGQPQYVVVT